MTAASSRRDSAAHPLANGASPAVIRQWLLPRDARRFVSEYEEAIDEARTSLDLAAVFEVIERWRRIAILQTDPEAYRQTIRRAAELATGQASPDDEPIEVSAAKAGM
jgi:hypothetical protein